MRWRNWLRWLSRSVRAWARSSGLRCLLKETKRSSLFSTCSSVTKVPKSRCADWLKKYGNQHSVCVALPVASYSWMRALSLAGEWLP
ncbi:hypothetical protein D9M70_610980 [compost metagenome]